MIAGCSCVLGVAVKLCAEDWERGGGLCWLYTGSGEQRHNVVCGKGVASCFICNKVHNKLLSETEDCDSNRKGCLQFTFFLRTAWLHALFLIGRRSDA